MSTTATVRHLGEKSSAAQPADGNPANAKVFNVSARKQAVESICVHAAHQHAAMRQVGVVQPDFPAVLVTGDWNLSLCQWRCLSTLVSY